MRDIFRLLLTILITFTFLTQTLSAASPTTAPTDLNTISLQYTNMFLSYPEGILREEGVLMSFLLPLQKVGLSVGFFSTSVRKGTTGNQSLSLDAAGKITGSALGDFSFDANVDSGGLTFSQSFYKQYYDFVTFLSRSMWDKSGYIGNKKEFYNSYKINLYIHGGFRYGIRSDTTNYTVKINKKKIDELNNPLGRTRNTGILFLLGTGIDARVSHLIGRVDLLLTYPIKESFLLFSIGGSI